MKKYWLCLERWPWPEVSEAELSAESTEGIVLTMVLNKSETTDVLMQTDNLVHPLVLLFLVHIQPRDVVQVELDEDLSNPGLWFVAGQFCVSGVLCHLDIGLEHVDVVVAELLHPLINALCAISAVTDLALMEVDTCAVEDMAKIAHIKGVDFALCVHHDVVLKVVLAIAAHRVHNTLGSLEQIRHAADPLTTVIPASVANAILTHCALER